MTSDVFIIAVILIGLVIGELVFRRIPGAGGLLYNLSGTLGGLFWILAGIFLAWGGARILGLILIIIGVNIHRSNYRTAKRALADRRSLNG